MIHFGINNYNRKRFMFMFMLLLLSLYSSCISNMVLVVNAQKSTNSTNSTTSNNGNDNSSTNNMNDLIPTIAPTTTQSPSYEDTCYICGNESNE